MLVGMMLVACGAKASEAPDCAKAAHAIEASMGEKDDSGAPLPKDVLAKIGGAIEKRCGEDEWSAEARRCHANVKKREDNVACGKELTPAQRNEVKRAIVDVVAEARDDESGGRDDDDGGERQRGEDDDDWVGAKPQLAVTGLEPASGDVEGGTYVVIRGKVFLADGPRSVKVYFGPRQGTVVRFQSDRELIVQAPGGKAGEVVDVRLVFEPGGELSLTSAFTFVDRSGGVPSIDDLAK